MARTGGERTKAKILGSAVRLFGSGGYEATSLDEVAADVGVRKQTLLYYFPSKADLFAAAAAEAAQAMYEALDGALKENDPGGLDRLPVFVDAVTELAGERPEVFGLIREVARAGPPVSDRVAEALRRLVDSAAAWFERGMDEGVIRTTEPAPRAAHDLLRGRWDTSPSRRCSKRSSTTNARRCASEELVAFLRAALAPERLSETRARPARRGT